MVFAPVRNFLTQHCYCGHVVTLNEKKKKKETISSVKMCFLYLAMPCAKPEKRLDSAGLSASNLLGMPHVKSLQNQDFSKKTFSLCLNRMEILNREGLGPINARTSYGETWELYGRGTVGLGSK